VPLLNAINRTIREETCGSLRPQASERPDSITLSKEYRFIAIATYIANRRSHQDYVFFQDADVKAPSVKLFGSEDDWKVKKQDIIF